MKEPGNLRQIKQLFLSPEWDQLRQAFDNMHNLHGLNATFSMSINNDSTAVSMNFNLKDAPTPKHKKPHSDYGGMTQAQITQSDSLSLVEMKKRVIANLRQIGITSEIYDNIFIYNKIKVWKSSFPRGEKPAFTSKTYTYDIQNYYKYQLLLPAINSVVWYRMRYYLASSVIMILLTCTAFYFILRLLRKQQLYADAKAHFASNMTHEFKTPIATVSVALESIKKYNLVNDPETLQNYLDISQHELQRLNLMVEKVLNISQDND